LSFSSTPGGLLLYPAWSPDSRPVAFTSTRGGKEEIYVKPFAGGRHQQLLLSVEGNAEVDGGLRMAVLSSSDYIGTKNGADVWALPLFGERKPFPFPSKSPMPLR